MQVEAIEARVVPRKRPRVVRAGIGKHRIGRPTRTIVVLQKHRSSDFSRAGEITFVGADIRFAQVEKAARPHNSEAQCVGVVADIGFAIFPETEDEAFCGDRLLG